MGVSVCKSCARLRKALELAEGELERLRAELAEARTQLRELTKLTDLQEGDLKRLLDLIKRKGELNQPERVADDRLQTAFKELLEELTQSEALKKAIDEAKAQDPTSDESETTERAKKNKKKGRRTLSLENLPVIEQRITPPEVEASGGEGWKLIDEETSERLGFRRARFECIRIIREKYVRIDTDGQWCADQLITAPLPDWVLPKMMADTSVMAEIIMSKYGFMSPWHRQEQINELRGFPVARSTQSDWTEAANTLAAPVVEAMRAESVKDSYCIATDATSAPVRIKGGCASWHMFVFIADAGHIFFMPTRRHNGAAVRGMLEGFRGHLLADAASIYNALFILGVVAVACWAHVRRYFWRATDTEPHLAHQALALIKILFDIAAKAKRLPTGRRGAYRKEYATPVVQALDEWVVGAASKAEPGGRIQAALTYYNNQREALGRFLADERLEMDNNFSERELRALVQGRLNWKHFETKAGLQWFGTFRSLISSCKLHDLNPYDYLEQMLRIVRHWPSEGMLALSPKYWRETVKDMNEAQQRIIKPPWVDISNRCDVAMVHSEPTIIAPNTGPSLPR